MIKNYLADIKAVDVNQQKNVFHHNRWHTALLNKAPSLDFCKHLNGKKITRKEVMVQFDYYFKNSATEDIITPFLLCMIWGYEGSGYGPVRTLRYFDDKDLVNKLSKAFQEIEQNNMEAAFNELVSINYLSTSFASKVLYFAAKSKGIKNYPLIFDMRAATGLITIACANKITQLVSITPKKGWSAYKSYCDQIHEWAKEYDIEAEKIETFLFNIPDIEVYK